MTPDGMELLGSDDLATSDDAGTATRTAPCPIVGVGASAGGLEAFQTFLSAAPADAGLAYGGRQRELWHKADPECHRLRPSGRVRVRAFPERRDMHVSRSFLIGQSHVFI